MMITTADGTFQGRSWQDPPKSHDTSILKGGLFAKYKAEAFNTKILPGRAVECMVGEWIEIFSAVSAGNTTYTLQRKPKGSKVELSQRQFKPDVPGYYPVLVSLNDAWHQVVHVAAFPDEVNRCLGYTEPRHALDRRLRLREICRDKRVNPQTLLASLEGDDPSWGMTGGIVGLRALKPGEGADGAAHAGFSPQQYNAGG